MPDRGTVDRCAKRVRTFLGGVAVADTTRPLLVWESAHFPTYYFPTADVRTDLLAPTGESHRSPDRGDAEVHTVKAGDREAPGAARWYRRSRMDELADSVRFEWAAMDSWFEEDEEVYVHARDPYTRIDVLQSSRHVRVVVDGVEVASSAQPRLLFETGLPTRYYLPKTDVRMDLLLDSDTVTHCPYKGTAGYYSVRTGDEVVPDLVWWYKHPTAESQQIAGYVAFYDEKVDVYVDGELQERPRTPFSEGMPRSRDA